MIVLRSFLVQLMLGSGWMLSKGISPMGRRRPFRRGILGMVWCYFGCLFRIGSSSGGMECR